MKRTKIVCTIGPASESRSNIEKMIAAGLNVARLNFSHGTYRHHAMLIRNIRGAAKVQHRSVAILQDLQGPRIRVGDLPKAGVRVKTGDSIALVPEKFKSGHANRGVYIPIQFPTLYRYVKAGHPILIDDGKIELKVTSVKQGVIHCVVRIGDLITSHRGMNFPKSVISAPAVTDKDKQDLEFGLQQNVDFVALSFVRDADDVIQLRHFISKIEKQLGRKADDFKKPAHAGSWPGTHTKIIAKIERPQAVKNFESILKAADGIMVARGDLGLEMPLEDLPLVQKKIIRRCVEESKPVIVATQMLDSMIRYPMPTRAEVSDVANAILDGTDAIMLSGETATGKYPLRAVQVMTRIANEVESVEISEHEKIQDTLRKSDSVTETVSFAVQNIAVEVGARLIVCATTSGFTARSIVKYRPAIQVVAVAATEKIKNQLCLSWGVTPYRLPFANNFNELIAKTKVLLKKEKLVKTGDRIVLSAGHPLGYLGQTNLIKVEIV